MLGGRISASFFYASTCFHLKDVKSWRFVGHTNYGKAIVSQGITSQPGGIGTEEGAGS
jgi:hypothetical protein